ncbi:hypothetical protein V7654_01575 [Bacillus sp. JJ1609]|uniref:hypothetical protein n=1 Tax=Bacillus sp. JJ1609 TaxID=3122977 RepID=UPI002FFF0A6E
MNKLVKPFAVLSLSAMFIAGCGSDEQPADKTTASKPVSTPENTEKEQADGQETTDQKQSEEKGEDGVIRILEQNFTYKVNGEQKEETAFLKYNDNQNYSMYVLPEYELTGEEPNKDVLFLTEDDSVFMRIELLPADIEWALMEENTKAQLTAVGPDVKEAEIPDDAFFENAWAMETKSGPETVTSYLIKNEQQPIKLTLFTKDNADHRNAFLEMGKTILKGNK